MRQIRPTLATKTKEIKEMTAKKLPGGQPGDKRHGRSAVSNGSKMLDGADGRSKQARRLRDLINDFTTELGGGDLSPVEAMLVRNAAMSAMKSEEQQAKMAAGGDVTDEDAVRVGNMCSRAARDLATAKAKRPVAGAVTIDTIAAWPTSEPAADEEIDDMDGFEPVPGFDDPAPEPVCTPSEPEPEPFEPPAPKQGPITVHYDARPGTEPGRTLHQVVHELQSHAPNALVTFTTPSISAERSIDRLLAEAVPLASRSSWHVTGLAP
jgi:hypothetical protein